MIKVTIECNCGNKFGAEGNKITLDPFDESNIYVFINDDGEIVFECEECQCSKIRMKCE